MNKLVCPHSLNQIDADVQPLFELCPNTRVGILLNPLIVASYFAIVCGFNTGIGCKCLFNICFKWSTRIFDLIEWMIFNYCAKVWNFYFWKVKRFPSDLQKYKPM